MLLLLIQMECFLDLVTQALAIGRVAMAAMLLLVDVAGATSLQSCQWCTVHPILYDVHRCGTRLAHCAG
jgi:hypothetical protein